MDKQKYEYRVVNSGTHGYNLDRCDSINKIVNYELSKGWKLKGDPFTCDNVIYQALVRSI